MGANLERVREFVAAWKRKGRGLRASRRVTSRAASRRRAKKGNDLDEIMGFFAKDCVYHNCPHQIAETPLAQFQRQLPAGAA